MNWVDLAVIILLVVFTLEGYKKNFLFELLDFLSFLLAFILSLRFYNEASKLLAANFQLPHSISNVLGFIAVWFLVETILFGVVHYVLAKKSLYSNVKLNFLSVVPAFLRGLIFISIILVMVGTFPIQPQIKIAVSESKLGSLILSRTQRLEGPLKNVFGGISQDSLTFLTIKPKSDETVNLGFQTNQSKTNESLESEMIELLNNERTSRGLKKLIYNEKLRAVARYHSTDMFRRGYFSHYSPEGKTVADRGDQFGVSYMVIGENLAYAPTLSAAHTGLMNSEGHRANILAEDYGKIGIGVLDGGPYGLMITQVFSN